MQLLEYLASNKEAKVCFHISDMVLNINSDASYLSETGAQSHVSGHFFMVWVPKDGESIQLNGAFHTSSTIMLFVVVSMVEAKLGTLFHNCQTGIIFCLALEEMGHLQPRTQ